MPVPEDLKLERVAISDLHPDPSNARHHSNKNLRSIEGSLKRFGQQAPIVVDEHGIVVAGNGRLVAAEKLGWTHLWVIRTTLGEVDRVAYALADNRTSELATWDPEALAVHLGALQDVDFDLGEIGFDDIDLRKLLPDDPIEDDEVPEPPAEPETKPGDLIILGRHRLKCGDSTSADDVADALGGVDHCSVCFTDPPYSVDYGRSQSLRGGKKTAHDAYTEGRDPAPVLRFLALVPSSVLVMSYPVDKHFFALADAMRDAGWELRRELVWNKNVFSFWPSAKYQQKHEPILVCARKGAALGGNVPANETTVQDYAKPAAHDMHPTAKPIEMWAKLLGYHSNPGDAVFEPFSGSGTTLIAAEKLGRRCFGLEISPAYCDVIVQRWEKATGQKAERP
jgi:DNA modification methylase